MSLCLPRVLGWSPHVISSLAREILRLNGLVITRSEKQWVFNGFSEAVLALEAL